LKKNSKKKNKNDEDFVPHMEKIKEKEKEKLQKTFEVVFGKSKSSIKENSRDMKKKIYIYGLIFAVFILLVNYLLK
tara:strand:- start:532 stop:759 length:228 start_codon:yes stop_codon:yes gene_type:complete